MAAHETPLEYWLGSDQDVDFTIYAVFQRFLVDGTDHANNTIRDITGYTLSFMVKRQKRHLDGSALITKTATVSGAFNSAPGTNTQKATVTLVDTETDTEIVPGLAFWELRRTDAGAEGVLAYGTIDLKRGVQRA